MRVRIYHIHQTAAQQLARCRLSVGDAVLVLRYGRAETDDSMTRYVLTPSVWPLCPTRLAGVWVATQDGWIIAAGRQESE